MPRRAWTKSVFEYWTHALSYIPTRDFRFFVRTMKDHRANPGGWFSSVSKADLRKVMTLVKKGGALTIRDIEDDVLQEKDHPWASRKPSKRALQLAFYSGLLAISERNGMLKSYELIDRHFGWEKAPKAASAAEVAEYLLDRGTSLTRAGQSRLDLSPGRAEQSGGEKNHRAANAAQRACRGSTQ